MTLTVVDTTVCCLPCLLQCLRAKTATKVLQNVAWKRKWFAIMKLADRSFLRQAQVQQYVHSSFIDLLKLCTAVNGIADARSYQRKGMRQ